MEFISYGEKSGAKRGFSRAYKNLADEHGQYLLIQGDKWGFYKDDDGEPVRHQLVYAARREANGLPPAGMANESAHLADVAFTNEVLAANLSAQDAQALDEAIEHDTNVGEQDEDADAPPAPSAFGAFALSQLAGNVAPFQAPSVRTTVVTKIERNREECNGVKRPSSGTLCDQVWQIATKLSNGDEKPAQKIATLSEVVKAAEAVGINKFTARTQYARWRVFHGITGRVTSV